jgi:hypothetical protein
MVLVAKRVIEKNHTNIFRHAAEIPLCMGREFQASPPNVVIAELRKIDHRIAPCGTNFSYPAYVMIRSVEERGEHEILVGAGYYCGVVCGNHTMFTVKPINGEWQITAEEFKWIS